MAVLSPALADSAKVIRRVAVGERVEGRRRTTEVRGEPFRCRLIPNPAREVRDERGELRLVEAATLVAGVDDMQVNDEVFVKSRLVGDARWRVSGAPQVVITRRLGRAAAVPLERLADPPDTEVIP